VSHEPSPSPGAPPDALHPQVAAWRPVSPDLVKVELIGSGIWFLLLAGALTLGWFLVGHWLFVAGLVVVVALAAWRASVAVRAVRAWGYAERDTDLLVRHGLLIRRLSIVPYARMQFVDVTAGPLERAFGLATVQLHTASAASDARIPGLVPEEAARLRDRLTALGEDRAEGL
jgi:membrane protein YdbS with pleckstrin-like domain